MKVFDTILGLGALSAALAVALPAPAATVPSDQGRNCFFITQWRGWSAPAPDVLYLKVNNNEVFRVDLAAGSSSLRSPGNFLVSKVRGSNTVCSALDLDLQVSDHQGFKTPLFPRTLTRLTPEEVAALPPKDRP